MAILIMQYIKLISGLLFMVFTVDVNALQSIDQALQALKHQSLLLDRDVLLLEEKINKPLIIYITQRESEQFNLSIFTALLDGRLLVRHKYSKEENKALNNGGAQLLFSGALAKGNHKLTVFYRSHNGTMAGSEFSIKKEGTSSVLEIALGRDGASSSLQPDVSIHLLDQQPDRINSVVYHYIQYVNEINPDITLLSEIMKLRTLYQLDVFQVHLQYIQAKLYMDMGFYSESIKSFNQMIVVPKSTVGRARQVSKKIRNEVRFYLAKNYYYLGRYKKTIRLLNQVKFPKNDKIRAEVQHLYSLALMAQGKYGKAAVYLQDHRWKTPDNWGLYSQLNLSVALIHSGKINAAIESISNMGKKVLKDEEAKVLVDRANQSLGYLLLNKNMPDKAREYLERVSLNGPYSNLALLGAGWASARLQEYNQAIVPWSELQKQDIRDVAVQESMLTVPFAYEKMDQLKKSIHYYTQSVKVFEKEMGALIFSIAALKKNDLDIDLKGFDTASEDRWIESVDNASHSRSLRYIKQLINDNQFFSILLSFREAKTLKDNAIKKMKKITHISEHLLRAMKKKGVSYTKDEQSKNISIQMLITSLLKKTAQLKLVVQKNMKKIIAKLRDRALVLLLVRKEKLSTYLLQSRLALARNYDRLNP